MSQVKAKITKRKVRNVKARRDVKKKRAKKLRDRKNNHFGLMNFRELLGSINHPLQGREQYIEIHDELVARRVDILDFCESEPKGSLLRLNNYSLALTQVYLHRAYSLYIGAFQALAGNNIYLMTLSIRGFLEAVAGMGYLMSRVNSFKNGNISAEDLDNSLMVLLLGTKDEKIIDQDGSEIYSAKNVMSMLDAADKVFNSKVMNNQVPDRKMLRTTYEWLCEFCHPNFNSASLSYRLDKENQTLVFNHQNTTVTERESELIQNVFIGSYALIHMHDQTVVIADSLKP
ncbi:hypothetical protein [Photobacterium sanguinicancri]|uniref:hypothetical protein n=1 Tax=Photobacterium sanguinicancri TaxID=875932 RepID=UPI0026E19039|nr:hypothetical protein [Photobacterium sanguinicancri]MDO6501217.1 hypothetical protein [Photobacterium sanguinicancri]